jgi:phage shock protein PspC (stress-responsive transcriptional regulator)
MTKFLRRSRKGIVLGGVCAGLAKHFGMDPTIWRLIFFFGALFSVIIPFTLVYIVMWIVVPKEEK